MKRKLDIVNQHNTNNKKQKTTNVIYFYNQSDKYGCFSNFFKRDVIIDGKYY